MPRDFDLRRLGLGVDLESPTHRARPEAIRHVFVTDQNRDRHLDAIGDARAAKRRTRAFFGDRARDERSADPRASVAIPQAPHGELRCGHQVSEAPVRVAQLRRIQRHVECPEVELIRDFPRIHFASRRFDLRRDRQVVDIHRDAQPRVESARGKARVLGKQERESVDRRRNVIGLGFCTLRWRWRIPSQVRASTSWFHAGAAAGAVQRRSVQVGVLGQCKEPIIGHFLHREVVQFFERVLRSVTKAFAQTQPAHHLARRDARRVGGDRILGENLADAAAVDISNADRRRAAGEASEGQQGDCVL